MYGDNDSSGFQQSNPEGSTPNQEYVTPLEEAPNHSPSEALPVEVNDDSNTVGSEKTDDGDSSEVNSAEHESNPEIEAQKTHEFLEKIIKAVPSEYLWGIEEDKGLGENARRVSNADLARIRFYSMPSTKDPNTGQLLGELFMSLGFMKSKLAEDKLNDPYAIMITEQHGSGNPWGDVLGSLDAGAIVRKYDTSDTYFMSSDEAKTRRGKFTYGPARLEEKQNAEQANNPMEPTSVDHLREIRERLEDATIQSPSGETLKVTDLLHGEET